MPLHTESNFPLEPSARRSNGAAGRRPVRANSRAPDGRNRRLRNGRTRRAPAGTGTLSRQPRRPPYTLDWSPIRWKHALAGCHRVRRTGHVRPRLSLGPPNVGWRVRRYLNYMSICTMYRIIKGWAERRALPPNDASERGRRRSPGQRHVQAGAASTVHSAPPARGISTPICPSGGWGARRSCMNRNRSVRWSDVGGDT